MVKRSLSLVLVWFPLATFGQVISGGPQAAPSNSTPIVDGTGAAGTSRRYARGDHVHPTDTSRAPVATPTFTGTASVNGLVSTALATPVNSAFSQADTGGTLLDSTTYYYRVTALDAAGETVASTETSQATSGLGGNQHTVTVNWGAVTGATSYKVYGRSTGAELYMATVSAPTITWVDDGSVTPSGALPTYGTSGNVSAPAFSSTAASGLNGFSCNTNGCRIDLGSGANDYFYSDGGAIYTPTAFFSGYMNTYLYQSPANMTLSAGSGIIYFGNHTTTLMAMDSAGGLQLGIGNTAAPATCDASIRGRFWYQGGGAGVKDSVVVCAKDASDVYAWRTIY